MLEILQYEFFRNALIGGILISLIASILGVFVIMRKEANITHSISNFLFLGIAVSLLMNGDYYLYAFIFGIIGSLLIFFIEKNKFITKESTKEIISQTGVAGALFTVGFMSELTLDINNLLFGSILFINDFDIKILVVFLVFTYILLCFYGRKFLSVIVNHDIARSLGIKIDYYNIFFLIFLSLFIAIAVKIFGILLVGAFLVIPVNISKILCKSIKGVFILSVILSVFSTITGLFASYYLSTSTGASIILILVSIFIISAIFKRK